MTMNRRQYQKQSKLRQEKQDNINNHYFVLCYMLAFLLLFLAAFMLDDAAFSHNWPVLCYLAALACFVFSVVLLIAGDHSKIISSGF